jgi:hypothetical protein
LGRRRRGREMHVRGLRRLIVLDIGLAALEREV